MSIQRIVSDLEGYWGREDTLDAMTTLSPARRLTAAAVAAVTLGFLGLTAACGSKTEAPSTTTTTTTTTTTSVSPTEKGINPTGGNKFTPTVKAPGPATAIPGDN